MLPQWYVKDLGHSSKSADGMLHLNTHTPLNQRSRTGLAKPLSRRSVGTFPETSSHATCQGTFGHSRLSSLSHCGRILALAVELACASKSPLRNEKKKEKKKLRQGKNGRTFSQKPSQARKKPANSRALRVRAISAARKRER